MRQAGGLVAFRNRDFRLLWFGLLVSHLGAWMQQVSNSWLLLELTNSPLLLGLQGVFMSVPFITFSLLGGALADRFDRRRLLTVTQTTMIATAFAQGALVQFELIQVWQIYAFGALNWAVAAVDTAGRQALLPALVPREHMGSAIALNSSLRRGSGIVGPALGGLAIGAFGLAGAYYVNALSFLPVVLALAVMRVPALTVVGGGSLLHSVADGIRYARRSRVVGGLLVLEACTGIFTGSTALIAIFARDVLAVGPEGLGLLLSAIGIGATLGTGLLLLVGDIPRKGRYVLLGSAVYPLVLGAFALSTDFGLSFAILLGLGVVDMVVGTLRNTVIQLTVEDHYRGRVMGMLSIATRGVSPLSGLQVGLLASVFAAPVAVLIGSGVALACALWIARRVPEIALAPQSVAGHGLAEGRQPLQPRAV